MNDKFPVGYAAFLTPDGHRIALPRAVGLAVRQERDARKAFEFEAERAAQAAQSSTEAKATAKEGAEAPARRFPAEPPIGWYRVLPGLQAMVDAGDESSVALRAADGDVRDRNKAIRRKLIDKGPDRRVAFPADWREALNKLEAALPNFREPVLLLRQAFALADSTQVPVRVPPMLLLGPPGIGKTLFTHRLADLVGAPHAAIAFDQPTAGSQLRGSDKFWGNTESGLLLNLICFGDFANPIVLLDELDKAQVGSGSREMDPLSQLHGALERQTARRTVDISTDIEFDASQVTYVATANSLRGVGLPILSRFEIFDIRPCPPTDAVPVARAVVNQVLERFGLGEKLQFERKCLYVLAHMSPRLMHRTVEKLVAAAVADSRSSISEADLWAEVEPDAPRWH